MKFGKSVGVLTLGTGISQGVMLLGVIILSRLYSPEEFGAYGVILGIATVVSVASSFRYEMTILLPKNILLAELALRLSLLVSILVNSAVLLGFAFLALADVVAPYWVLIPLAAFCASVINIGSFLQNRKKQYRRIAGVQVMRSVLFVFLSVFAYVIGYDGNGLILSMVLSMGIVASYLLLFDFRQANGFRGLSRQLRLKVWARKHRKFVFYSTPAVFVNNLATQAPVFLLSGLSGADTAGYYLMIQRVMMAPVSLVSGAVNKIYMQTVASLRANGQGIYQFTTSIVRRFRLPGLVLACVMFIAFQLRILETVFGLQWEGIDSLAMVMIPAFCISFVAKSISGFAILGRNELGLIYQVILLVLVAFTILISTSFSDSRVVVFIAISTALSLCFLGQSVSILRISRNLDTIATR